MVEIPENAKLEPPQGPFPPAPNPAQIPQPPFVAPQINLAQGLPFPPGIALIQHQALWAGPYPPPDAIKAYEEVLPGVFDRMVKMAEGAQEAQIEGARDTRALLARDIRRGHWLGFAAIVGAMIGAGFCAALGSNVVAGIFLSVPVMTVISKLFETAKSKPIAPITPPSK